MSKTGQWVFGMQEDATWMSRDVFIRVHGIGQVDIFDKVNSDEDDYYEPEIPEEVFEAETV
jgi:hypothetical protein